MYIPFYGGSIICSCYDCRTVVAPDVVIATSLVAAAVVLLIAALVVAAVVAKLLGGICTPSQASPRIF